MIATKSSPRRILLVALDNLGDLVFASALTPPLHHAFPDATIDIWCKAYTADVARLVPHVSDVIASDPFWSALPGHQKPPMRDFLRGISVVRSRGYDTAILSEAPWRAAAAVAAARIPRRIGLARRRNSIFLTDVLPAQDPDRSVLREQARLLTALGVQSSDPRYCLDANKLGDLRANIARRLPPRFAAIHAFAAVRDRCVAVAEWLKVSRALDARGLPTVWIGRSAELDEIRAASPPSSAHFADRLSDARLESVAAALSLATVFAGHDSGPLHVAGAFGVPVLGVFAPGQPRRTFPQGVGASRMLHRATPAEITADAMLAEIDVLISSS